MIDKIDPRTKIFSTAELIIGSKKFSVLIIFGSGESGLVISVPVTKCHQSINQTWKHIA